MDFIKKHLWADSVSKLITVNFIVWVAIALGLFINPSGGMAWVGLFALPADAYIVPQRIWTLLSYMFSHIQFSHLAVNMLWLLVFGRLMQPCIGQGRLVVLYLIGGLAGAAVFLICSLAGMASYPYLIGASCSVMAVIGASLAAMPRARVNLAFMGDMALFWLAAAAIVLLLIMSPDMLIMLTHLGGLAAGLVYGLVFKSMSAVKVLSNDLSHGDLDDLLAKVGRSGYASLSPRERQRLFELTRNIQR